MSVADCPLCDTAGGVLVWRGAYLRVVAVEDADFPGFCRVIWNDHVAEMSELDAKSRDYLWRILNLVESSMRAELMPDKINLASLGNVVPHLHWHMIPRWRDDRCFPEPIWSSAIVRPLDRESPVWSGRRSAAKALCARLPQLLNSTLTW